MYNTSLYLHFIGPNQHVVKMFFEDWADRICNGEVKYSVVSIDGLGQANWDHTIRVDFVNSEDATIMKLKGIPEEFRKYLKFVDWSISVDDTALYQVN